MGTHGIRIQVGPIPRIGARPAPGGTYPKNRCKNARACSKRVLIFYQMRGVIVSGYTNALVP